MQAKLSDAEIHKLVGGALCLDFANTLYGHTGEAIHEYLFNYRDLVLWSRHAGILTDDQARSLLAQAEHQPREARLVFARAISLRESLFRIFRSLARTHAHKFPIDVGARGGAPKDSDLQHLNRTRSQLLRRSSIKPTPNGYAIDWGGGQRGLDSMLTPLVLSAVDLLTSGQAEKLRECDGDTCDWLFLDTSRNHQRRWCSMEHCGNRAKSRRHYEKVRKTSSS